MMFILNKGLAVTISFIRSHVMGSNDDILCEAGRTTAVSLVGTRHGPGDALGQIWDISSWSLWATTVSVSGLVLPTGTGGQVPIKGNGVFTTGAFHAEA
jgi:hypothetical protein